MEADYIYAFFLVLAFFIVFVAVIKGQAYEESQKEKNKTITNESVPLQKSIPNQTEEKKEVQEHRVMVQIFYGLISVVLFLAGVVIKNEY